MTAWTFLGRVLYWTAVLAVSLALVFLFLRFFEPRDDPQLEQPAAALTAAEQSPTTSSNGAP